MQNTIVFTPYQLKQQQIERESPRRTSLRLNFLRRDRQANNTPQTANEQGGVYQHHLTETSANLD